jgi:CRP/FNR family cyclic AMP-dependent transcriptional regulator
MNETPTPLDAFKGVHIFAGLSDDTLHQVALAARPLKVPRGSCVVQEGTSGGCLYLLVKGTVEVVKGAGTKKEVRLAELGVGEFFGEMGLIEPRKRSASIRAAEAVSLYSLERSDLLDVFKKSPREYAILVTNIARDLCRRLRRMDEVFAAVSF